MTEEEIKNIHDDMVHDFRYAKEEALKNKTIGGAISQLYYKQPEIGQYWSEEVIAERKKQFVEVFCEITEEILSTYKYSQEDLNDTLRYAIFHERFDNSEENLFFRVAEMLLARGADINAPFKNYDSDYTRTIIHSSLHSHNSREEVPFLLEHGGSESLKIADSNGDYPIHLAARCNDMDIVEMLCKHDPTIISQTNKNGETALFYLSLPYGDSFTAEFNYRANIGKMRRLGFDINHQNNQGRTILSKYAAYEVKPNGIDGYLREVEILTNLGVDPKIKDNDGKTAADYVSRNIDNCINSLTEKGQKTLSGLGETIPAPKTKSNPDGEGK